MNTEQQLKVSWKGSSSVNFTEEGKDFPADHQLYRKATPKMLMQN